MTSAPVKKAVDEHPLTRENDERTRDSSQESTVGRADKEEISDVVRNTRVSFDLKSEKLKYILEMLNELRQLSTTIDEPMVAYLIEMAVLETNTAINVLDFDVESVRDKRAL